MSDEGNGRVQGGDDDARRSSAERFLDLFNEAERALKRKMKLLRTNRTGFGELVRDYLARTPSWREDADDLDLFADIRNILSHQRSVEHGHPVQVPQVTIERLEAILDRLAHPVTIGQRFKRDVIVVAPADPLHRVLTLAYENEFSQFPVVDSPSGRFLGLITENSVTRWLGRRSIDGRTTVTLTEVSVRQVMKEEEPGRRGVMFRFNRPEAPEGEIMGLFAAHPELEVVLLTSDGTSKTRLEGIVTEWDAARHIQIQT